MRGHDPQREQEFFDIFAEYFDLESNTGRKYTAGEYTLDRMQRLAALAGHPEERPRIAHVAGTKGKGSTCFLLSSLLLSAGQSCGVFTSPHLATVRERFVVNGALVPYADLLSRSRALEASIRDAGLQPTLFEIMTVLALQIFAASHCRYVILEVGIGGLLDSTNFVPRTDCSIITPISYDHTQLLGSTIEEIAAQKAGIIRPDTPVVLADQPFREAHQVVRRRAAELGAPVFAPAPLCPPSQWGLGAAAPFIQANMQTALRACDVLEKTPSVEDFRLPELRGRCERISSDPLVVIDGAHNADSCTKLTHALAQLHPGVRFTVVLGVVAGKDAAGIFDALCRGPMAQFVLTNPHSHKGSQLNALIALADARNAPYQVVPDIRSKADLPSAVPLLFTGSFFTALIGEKLFSGDPV